MLKKYKYIYGPVSSWRLGSSLGVDPITSDKGKVCSFDCVYCQVGKTKQFLGTRKTFVPTKKILQEIKSLPPVKIDYITFSGAGEPTLAKNLGKLIKEIRKIKKAKIAVITNATLMNKKDVRKDLAASDLVMAKLDAHSEKLFCKVNKPFRGISFENVIKGLKKFRKLYKKKLALQIMFTKANKNYAEEISELAKSIKPDEIQINTPLRRCRIKPLSKKEIKGLKKFFKGTSCVSVYEKSRKKVKSIIVGTNTKRRGKV